MRKLLMPIILLAMLSGCGQKLPLKYVGNKKIQVNQIQLEGVELANKVEPKFKTIPWLQVTNNFDYVNTKKFWKIIPSVPDTKAAFVGKYTEIPTFYYGGASKRITVNKWGVSFSGYNKGKYFTVQPLPRNSSLGSWIYKEESTDKMSFRENRFYIFCFNTIPFPKYDDSFPRILQLSEGSPLRVTNNNLGSLSNLIGIIELKDYREK